MKHYYSHRVYTDASFYDLAEALASFLSENTYVGYSSDFDRDYETLTHSSALGRLLDGVEERDTSTHIIASIARSIAEDSGEILFRVVNLRLLVKLGKAEVSEIAIKPSVFEQCPNYVEIETHRKWWRMREHVGEKLSEHLNANGHQTYIRSFEGELLDVIESAYPDVDEKADAIHRLVEPLYEWSNLPEFDFKTLPLDFITIMPRLHSDTILALRTAEFLRSRVSPLPDCSPIVIEYCKALEIEFTEKFLNPLRTRWNQSNQPPPKPTNPLRRIHNFIFKQGRKLELGAIAYSLDSSLQSSNSNNALATSLREAFFDAPEPTWFSSDYINRLRSLVQEYRNPAAHTTIMLPKDIEACRDIVIGTNTQAGLLTMLLREH